MWGATYGSGKKKKKKKEGKLMFWQDALLLTGERKD